MVNPLLSIITVSLNDHRRLGITIDSLSDYYGDLRFEHVIIDGNSTDKTDFLVLSLRSNNNFKFIKGGDSGIYDAMNRGAHNSSAQLLLFLNCGDTLLASPDQFAIFLNELFLSSGALNFDIACFPIQQFGMKGFRTIVPKRVTKSKMPVSHQGMIFSKLFLQSNMYQTCYKIAGDYDLYLRASRIRFIDNVSMPIVRTEVEGVASSNPFRAYQEYIEIAHKRLSGYSRLLALTQILFRSLFIISLKVILPKSWIAVLRGA
jgi:glycosyltransferase involved in cell wall biosynthesis